MAKRRRGKSKNSTGLVVAAIVLLGISVSIIGGYFYLRSKAADVVALDKASLCPVDGPGSVMAVLLDVTDPIADVTAMDLRNEFQGLVGGVPKGGLLQVYALTDEEGQLKLTFSGCNPGDGSTANEWIINPIRTQERWEKGFEKPLRELANRLQDSAAGKQSPIMAAIQRINVEAFGKPEYRAVPKTLIIASDMIEHTQAFSIYRDGTSYQRFEESAARQKFRSPLSGVSVRILEFQRPGMSFSDEDLSDFWHQWISSNMGELTSFKRLQGVL